MQPQQFLIEVKAVTQKFNRLHSGESEDGRKTASIRGPELLIPELCHNFHFPGDLWLKLTIMPSVLHRLFNLLHAEQIRLDINTFVGLNIIDYQPQPVPERTNRQRPKDNPNDRRPEISYMQTNQRRDKKFIDHESISSRLNCPWNEYEQPIDLHRNLDSIYQLEIDYHHEFITRKLNRLNIIDELDEDDEQSMRARYISQDAHRPRTQPMAICDATDLVKMKIDILSDRETAAPRGVEQHEILTAITASSSGDIFDSERLEVLGDAFLKFGVSMYLIQTHSNWHEGHLTSVKGQLVSNRNLFYLAHRWRLPGMLKINKFAPKDDWLPPMVRVPEFVQVFFFWVKRLPK